MDATRDCNFYQEQLSAYIDDELGRSERRSLDAHLAACAVCTASLARLRSVVAELKGMPRMQTGPDYLIALRRRIDRGDARGESLLERIDWFRVNFALGAATLGVVALVMFRSPAWQEEARWLPVPGAGQVISDAAAPAAAPPAEHGVEARKSLDEADAAAAPFAGKAAPVPPAPAVAVAPVQAAQVAVADVSMREAEAAPRKERARAVTVAADRKKSAPVAMASKPTAPAPAASPAAPLDSGPLARAGGAGSMGLGLAGAPSPVDLGGAFAAPERDVVRDGMSTGLNVGALTPAGPATDRDPVLSRALAQAPAEEKASAQEDSFSKAEEAAPAASSAGSAPAPAPALEPQAVPAGVVTHEVLVQYLGSRVVSGSAEAPAKDKGEATILVKTTQLSAFLRTLREKADELKVSDAVETSGATFEFSIRGRGGKEGLEALAARLSAFPGAQPAGLMFEKVPDAGDYTCRVLVAVE